jgi:two-component system, cell cycle sensor histidine kinase and response regulator CckA
LDGRFLADGEFVGEIAQGRGHAKRLVLLDPWRDGALRVGLHRKLESIGYDVHTIRLPIEDLIDAVSKVHPDAVVLAVDEIDAAAMRTTEMVTAKARVPVIWFVRDASIEPWASTQLLLLNGADRPETLRARIDTVLRGPPIPTSDASPVIRAMLDATPVGIVVISPNHGILSASAAMLKMLGYTEAELQKAGLAGFTHPEDMGVQLEQYREMLVGARSEWKSEKRYVAKNGNVIWGRVTTSLVNIGSEQSPLIFAMVQDWQQHKNIEKSLAESESRFSQAMDSMPVVFWAVTPDWQEVVYVSPAFERVYGCSRASLAENPTLWLDAIHPEDRGRVLEHFEKHHGESGEIEYRIVRTDGDVRWLRDVMFPIFDAEGRLSLLSGFGEDVTERKRDADERARMVARLQRAEKLESLGLLAGGFAHDFNNLLLSIRGYAELAKGSVESDSVASSHLEGVLKASRRAGELCSQMLTCVGKGSMDMRAIGLSSLVEEVVSLLRVSVPAETTIVCQLSPDLPRIRADATQVRQVLMNLILNASDSFDGRQGTVSVTTAKGGFDLQAMRDCFLDDRSSGDDGVVITVADTGTGMEPDTQQRIFDPFFTTKTEGRGLGLAAVLGIVRSHRGAISLKSQGGEGTVFQVLFPAM